MGVLEEVLASIDNARRVGSRNIQDLWNDPSAYAEKITGHLRNTNAGVAPVAAGGELTNRPLTDRERAEQAFGAMDFGGGLGVIKPKGGNWLSGKYGPEAQFKALKRQDATRAESLAGVQATPGLTPEQRQTIEGVIARAEFPDQAGAAQAKALNSWIDNQLTKYVKNDMASPVDPVRLMLDKFPEEKAQKLALAEARVEKLRAKQQAQAATRGVPEEYLTQTRQDILKAEEARDLIAENVGLHYTPQASDVPGESYMLRARSLAGMPVKPMAQSPLAKSWEDLADYTISVRPAKDYQLPNNLKEDPWLAKVDPNTKIYSPGYDPGRLKHVADELANSLREGRLTPEQLSKMPVDQAIRHVAEINALRAVEANKARAMDMADMPVFKDYPEQGMSWRQLKAPELTPERIKYLESQYPEENAEYGLQYINNKQLQKWLTQEGDSMAHCVGGYCDDVASGRSNIYSLRDAKGKPYVTIETDPGLINMSDFTGGYVEGSMNQADAIKAIQALEQSPEWKYGSLSHWIDTIKENREGVPRVLQVKGPRNLAPAAEHLPFVQDFIKQGKWGSIEDLHHTGLDPLQIDQYLVE